MKSSTAATWQQLFGLDRILFGFLLLSSSSVFQSASVPGGRFSNPPTTPSPVRIGNALATCKLETDREERIEKYLQKILDGKGFND